MGIAMQQIIKNKQNQHHQKPNQPHQTQFYNYIPENLMEISLDLNHGLKKNEIRYIRNYFSVPWRNLGKKFLAVLGATWPRCCRAGMFAMVFPEAS